jgi:hypothetical protein
VTVTFGGDETNGTDAAQRAVPKVYREILYNESRSKVKRVNVF